MYYMVTGPGWQMFSYNHPRSSTLRILTDGQPGKGGLNNFAWHLVSPKLANPSKLHSMLLYCISPEVESAPDLTNIMTGQRKNTTW